jgi:hypothetical protein
MVVARITAIAGGVFIFVVVYLLVGLAAIRATEGSPLEWAGVIFTFAFSAVSCHITVPGNNEAISQAAGPAFGR